MRRQSPKAWKWWFFSIHPMFPPNVLTVSPSWWTAASVIGSAHRLEEVASNPIRLGFPEFLPKSSMWSQSKFIPWLVNDHSSNHHDVANMSVSWWNSLHVPRRKNLLNCWDAVVACPIWSWPRWWRVLHGASVSCPWSVGAELIVSGSAHLLSLAWTSWVESNPFWDVQCKLLHWWHAIQSMFKAYCTHHLQPIKCIHLFRIHPLNTMLQQTNHESGPHPIQCSHIDCWYPSFFQLFTKSTKICPYSWSCYPVAFSVAKNSGYEYYKETEADHKELYTTMTTGFTNHSKLMIAYPFPSRPTINPMRSLPSELNGLDVGLSVGGSGERRSGVTSLGWIHLRSLATNAASKAFRQYSTFNRSLRNPHPHGYDICNVWGVVGSCFSKARLVVKDRTFHRAWVWLFCL